MPVLGADPDAPEREFPEYSPRAYASKPVNALTNHFAYHKGMRMSQRFNEQDRTIMNRFFSQALKKGYAENTLRDMVDIFWQTWGADQAAPALVFVSNDMQGRLTDRTVVERPSDPTLAWLFDGMPDSGPFKDVMEMRATVLIDGGDLILRYPDIVAACLRDDPNGCAPMLRYIRDVVQWHLGELDFRPTPKMWDRWLPEGLQSTTHRAPSRLRRKHDTVKQAIAAIPVRK